MGDVARRDFLAGMVGVGAAAVAGPRLLGGLDRMLPAAGASAASALPKPSKAPFDTVVVLMMENRSFDHFLGWLPGADGQQASVKLTDATGAVQRAYRMGSDVQGCQYYDPAHDWASMNKHLNGGKCDGFLLTQPDNDPFPISYYTAADLPVIAALARHHTVFDRYFCSILGPTWPNRMYQLAAATDLDMTGLLPDTGPGPSHIDLTIFDRAAAKGVSAGYYGFDGAYMTHAFASRRYDSITHPYAQFLTDAATGKLPHITFVDPNWSVLRLLTSETNDFHPTSSVALGESFVAEVYDALAKSPQWDRTVFVLNFDENGGFHDHVAPPKVADDNVNPNPGPHPDYTQLGFRVPCIAMGPFAPARVEKAGPYEHTSILKMIEWRWGLEPMTARDKNAKNLALGLDFTKHIAPVKLPKISVPPVDACKLKVASR